MYNDQGRPPGPPDLPEFDALRRARPSSANLRTLPDGRAADILGRLPRGTEGRRARALETWGELPDELRVCALALEFSGRDDVSPGRVSAPSLEGIAHLLHARGLRAELDRAHSLEDLAAAIEQGALVIAAVDAASLWRAAPAFDLGAFNHLILVHAIARDPLLETVIGAVIVDPATTISPAFISDALLVEAWLARGGWQIVVGANDPP